MSIPWRRRPPPSVLLSLRTKRYSHGGRSHQSCCLRRKVYVAGKARWIEHRWRCKWLSRLPLRKRKGNVFLEVSRSRLNFSLFLVKMQPTGNQQLLHAPDKRSITDAKERQRDVASYQISQNAFSNLVTFEFLEPAVNQKLSLETSSPVGTTAVLFFAKPEFVLAQWKHGGKEESPFPSPMFPKRPSR